METEPVIADLKSYIEDIKESFEVHLREIEMPDIETAAELRSACEQNFCGQYGKNWMCPPAVGKIDDLIAALSDYDGGVLIQTVHRITDSFDVEGMSDAAKGHDSVLAKIRLGLKGNSEKRNILLLGAGPCTSCEECACEREEECPFPEKALASVESYGIDVNRSLTNCGLQYNNGANTVSYVGLVLYKK